MTLAATLAFEAAADRHWDVVVIGAGPAGATAAILLARAGRRVLLVERKAFPRYKVCGGCLSAAGVALLDQLGALPDLRSAGAAPLRALELHAGGSLATLPIPAGCSISRSALDALLVRKAIEAGASFLPEAGATVSYHEGYQLALQSTAPHGGSLPVTARAVVVADGLGHPSLRGRERFGERVHPASRIGAGCLFPQPLPWLATDTVAMVVGAAGYVGLAAVTGGQTSIAAALDASFVRMHQGIAGACDRLLADAGLELPQTAPVHWLGTPALTRRTLRHADGPVFLLGDASGYVEPFTGEGMTWALASARDVVPYVEQTLAGHDVADAWSRQVTQLQRSRQRWCRAITAGLRLPTLPATCVHVLHAAPLIAQPIIRWITQRREPHLARYHP